MTLRAQQFASGFIAATDSLRFDIPSIGHITEIPVTMSPGYCYRPIVAVDAGVQSWEPSLVDRTGRVISADRAPDGFPVIGLNRPLCVPAAAPPITALIRVRGLSGSGSGAAQVFVVPFNANTIGGH